MPLGIVSDSDFESEINNSSVDRTLPEGRVDILPPKGRGVGNTEVPDGLRKIIGETGELDGRHDGVELAKLFGISESSVSAYQQGATSTATYDKTPNKEHINGAKERVARKARAKLFSALKHMTPEKMKEASARNLAGVARDMAAIVREMEPELPADDSKKGVTFVVFAPQIKQEKHYDVIEAPEAE